MQRGCRHDGIALGHLQVERGLWGDRKRIHLYHNGLHFSNGGGSSGYEQIPDGYAQLLVGLIYTNACNSGSRGGGVFLMVGNSIDKASDLPLRRRGGKCMHVR